MNMSTVTYIEPSGNAVQLTAPDGWTAMQVAVSNGVDGIEAECGGSCSCATCHCYVEAGGENLPSPSETELAMLEHVAAERRDNSRLCCQIKLDASTEGLTIRMPACQS
jgi:2Fe-2S ferredoxin